MTRAGELAAGTQMCSGYFVCTNACMYMYVCLWVGMVYVCVGTGTHVYMEAQKGHQESC